MTVVVWTPFTKLTGDIMRMNTVLTTRFSPCSKPRPNQHVIWLELHREFHVAVEITVVALLYCGNSTSCVKRCKHSINNRHDNEAIINRACNRTCAFEVTTSTVCSTYNVLGRQKKIRKERLYKNNRNKKTYFPKKKHSVRVSRFGAKGTTIIIHRRRVRRLFVHAA